MTESPADASPPPGELRVADGRGKIPADRRSTTAGLPPLWAGTRRRHLSLLVLSGLGQAAAAGVAARLISNLLKGTGGRRPLLWFTVLVAAAVAVGALRMAERILAERLSQDYVHEIRLGLIRRNLADGRVKSLGVAVARTTNDLGSVKNWVSQGVAPLAVGIPLIIGACITLTLLEPLLAVGLVVSIGVLLGAMRALAPVAYKRSRILRRRRGVLSSQVADTILSTPAIRSAGGSSWELRLIEKYSSSLVTAAVRRAQVAGALRGVAAATSGVAAAIVVGTGLLARVPTHSIAGALIIMGFMAGPIHDLGRVTEFRQTYRAARRIIGPAIQPADDAARPAGDTSVRSTEPALGTPADSADEAVSAAHLRIADGLRMQELFARPGDRIVVAVGSKRLNSDVLDRFVGLRQPERGEVFVAGRDLSAVGPKDLRRLVGYAAQGMMLVRATIARTVRYRSPATAADEVDRLLAQVGLADCVAQLPQGDNTLLVHGGEPLTIPERARLLLARAILNEPPLLVFDNLDADLGKDGRETMRRLLRDYPGVVLLASDEPDLIVTPTHVWRPVGVQPATPPQEARRRTRSSAP